MGPLLGAHQVWEASGVVNGRGGKSEHMKLARTREGAFSSINIHRQALRSATLRLESDSSVAVRGHLVGRLFCHCIVSNLVNVIVAFAVDQDCK